MDQQYAKLEETLCNSTGCELRELPLFVNTQLIWINCDKQVKRVHSIIIDTTTATTSNIKNISSPISEKLMPGYDFGEMLVFDVDVESKMLGGLSWERAPTQFSRVYSKTEIMTKPDIKLIDNSLFIFHDIVQIWVFYYETPKLFQPQPLTHMSRGVFYDGTRTMRIPTRTPIDNKSRQLQYHTRKHK